MKILIAVDGSAYTKKMLAYLVTHNEILASSNSLTLLTVQAQLPPHVRSVVGKQVTDDYHREESERVLAPTAKFLLRHGVNAKTLAKVGHAGEVICKTAASGKFDMVIMGSHGHGLFGNLVLGSVATQVLSHSKVPVLIVR
ncbi:MAG: universal stress protein [Betaproteobacteria bacterium]|nr:universal stress protein [Betaproteobacteria bacterium]